MSKIIARSIPALESQLDPPPLSVSELYHENTKLQPLTIQQMLPVSEFSAADLQAMSRAHKQYPNLPRVKLPAIESIPQNNRTFDEVVSSRRSLRIKPMALPAKYPARMAPVWMQDPLRLRGPCTQLKSTLPSGRFPVSSPEYIITMC